jgi:hypothetical protein
MSPQDEAEFRPNDVERNEFRSTEDASLQRLEAELAALTPRAPKLDRDRAMYLAGQASVGLLTSRPSGRTWAWPTAFSAMTALAASLLIVISLRPSVRTVEKIVQVPVEVAPGIAVLEETSDQYAADLQQPLPAATSRAIDERHSSPNMPAAEAGYLGLRDRVLAMGIESWQLPPRPSGERSPSQSVNYHELLNTLLRDG